MSMQVTKVWWDGEKLMAEPIPESEIYRESAQQQDDPCPGCRKGGVCRTPKCGRLNLPIDHPCRAEQPAQPQQELQTCNCRWDGDTQVQQCTLHEAHVAAIHEWAERAKTAEYEFKNFHRALCERFGYSHDKKDWKRDQLSLIEWISKQAQPEQEPMAWKLVPVEPTDEMLKAMDECSTEGYDERLYAGHAASVYMAAVDAAPQRKPLTHEQRVDLLARFEAHKHEWHAPAILIDMVEAAHGIKGDAA